MRIASPMILLSLASFFLLIFSPSLFANPKPNQTPSYENETWRYEIAPYLWALNMDGKVQVAGREAKVDQSFSDILHHLNIGGMVFLDVYKGKWDIFLNAIYAVLSDDAKEGPLSANAKTRFGLFSAGAAYQAYHYCFVNNCVNDARALTIEPYAGFRYTLNNTYVKVNVFDVHLKGKENVNWTDPLIGARLRYNMTQSWLALIGGDIGGTFTHRQHSYNLYALLGYQPQQHLTHTTFYLGYRLLDQFYAQGKGIDYYKWDMKLFGPMLGVAIDF